MFNIELCLLVHVMYMYLYIHLVFMQIYSCIHTCMHTYKHTHTHTYTYIHIYTYTYIHIYTHIITYIHIHTHTHMSHIYIYTWWYMCIFECDQTRAQILFIWHSYLRAGKVCKFPLFLFTGYFCTFKAGKWDPYFPQYKEIHNTYDLT